MTNNTITPLTEIISCVEDNLIKGKWQVAIEIWVMSIRPINFIRWLAKTMAPSVNAEFSELLTDIMMWREHDDELRRGIYTKSEELGFTTQAGALGLALFMCGGSMSPPEYDPINAPEGAIKQILYAILINQSVITSDTPAEGVKMLFQKWCCSH